MRLLTPLIAVTALALTASAFAQEEEATPATAPAEEQPATTIEETPAAPAPAPAIETTPMPVEHATAPPMTTPKPQRSAAPASSPAAKSSSPAPAAATTATAAGKKPVGVEATLKDNENRWAAAHGQAGVAVTEALIADDFIGISSKGKFTNRRSLISEMKGDKDTYTMSKNEKLDVHRYGNDVAVVVGKYHEKGMGKDKKPFDRTYFFTDTWMNRKGSWKCIASQSMILGGHK
jgi:type IV secretory pathway VirB10-like protein